MKSLKMCHIMFKLDLDFCEESFDSCPTRENSIVISVLSLMKFWSPFCVSATQVDLLVIRTSESIKAISLDALTNNSMWIYVVSHFSRCIGMNK